jgi:hypothetical protein
VGANVGIANRAGRLAGEPSVDAISVVVMEAWQCLDRLFSLKV